jgi:alpha-beta hydrolase superfamily lysophospholipase
MRVLKLFLLSASVLTSAVNAEINKFGLGESIVVDDMTFSPIVSKKSVIQSAARAASAAYNDRELVARKQTPLRKQVGFEDRDRLVAEGYEVRNFGAMVSGTGYLPAGIVAYKGKDIVIAFRGSECVEDFTNVNLRAMKMDASVLGIEGYSHGGFLQRYLASRGDLFGVIQNTVANNNLKVNDLNFLVTGHSLGGALATAAATDLKKNLVQDGNLNLVTFSSPRIFDHKAAEQAENLIGSNNMFRVWRNNDVVPMVSLGTQILGWFTGFKHVGQSMKLKETVNKYSLVNHKMESILRDAESHDVVDVDENHVGLRTRISNTINKGINKAKGFFSKVSSVFGY